MLAGNVNYDDFGSTNGTVLLGSPGWAPGWFAYRPLERSTLARLIVSPPKVQVAFEKAELSLTKTVAEQLIGQSKQKGNIMPKKAGSADSVYKVVELVGTSSKSWEDAAKNAVETAAGTLRDLRVAEIVKLDMTVENGKVGAYRARLLVSFKYGS